MVKLPRGSSGRKRQPRNLGTARRNAQHALRQVCVCSKDDVLETLNEQSIITYKELLRWWTTGRCSAWPCTNNQNRRVVMKRRSAYSSSNCCAIQGSSTKTSKSYSVGQFRPLNFACTPGHCGLLTHCCFRFSFLSSEYSQTHNI